MGSRRAVHGPTGRDHTSTPGHRLLLAIDEAPRLAGGHTDFADTVSAVWENHIRDQRLMVVLSGSAVAVMEQMLGPQGGLHRRAGVERRMDPFPSSTRGQSPESTALEIRRGCPCGGTTSGDGQAQHCWTEVWGPGISRGSTYHLPVSNMNELPASLHQVCSEADEPVAEHRPCPPA